MGATTDAGLARSATTMELALQLSFRRTEFGGGLDLVASCAFIRPILWSARVAHKLTSTEQSLAHGVDSVGLRANAASCMAKWIVQDAGLADLGAIRKIERVPLLFTPRARSCCCIPICCCLPQGPHLGACNAASPVAKTNTCTVELRRVVPVHAVP